MKSLLYRYTSILFLLCSLLFFFSCKTEKGDATLKEKLPTKSPLIEKPISNKEEASSLRQAQLDSLIKVLKEKCLLEDNNLMLSFRVSVDGYVELYRWSDEAKNKVDTNRPDIKCAEKVLNSKTLNLGKFENPKSASNRNERQLYNFRF